MRPIEVTLAREPRTEIPNESQRSLIGSRFKSGRIASTNWALF
jgi:hypothetical protein